MTIISLFKVTPLQNRLIATDYVGINKREIIFYIHLRNSAVRKTVKNIILLVLIIVKKKQSRVIISKCYRILLSIMYT